MADPKNLRALACEIIHGVVVEQQSLNTLMPLYAAKVSPKDKGLLQEIVFGVCRWYFALEDLHNRFLKKRLAKQDLMAAILLKVGAYQLHFTRIPKHAAINECVNAAKQLGLDKFTGLINAILRKVSKVIELDMDKLAADSHPAWFREKIRHNWPDQADHIFAQNNQYPPMTLRVNPQHVKREAYLDLLSAADIEASACEYAEHGITLSKPCNVNDLPHFADGYVSVQDEAAQLCCSLMDLQAEQRVLDACAAPGGKTCAMLEQAPEISMTALDSDEQRSKRIRENLARLKLSAQIHIAEGQNLEDWWDNKQFDRILLDAPCSATGVIRRHPDIKLLRKQEDIKQLAEVQLQLLRSLWLTLKEGGKLVYATCSVFPQENSRIIERFLKQETSASLETIDAHWGIDTGFGRQLMPQKGGHDGFFYACLSKG